MQDLATQSGGMTSSEASSIAIVGMSGRFPGATSVASLRQPYDMLVLKVLALLQDGSNKVIWLASENDAETPNKALRPYAGRKVTVNGTWAERGGAKLLIVQSVKPAGS